MSSTDAQVLGQFYDRRLLPVADALSRRGVDLLQAQDEAGADSWYTTPPRLPMFRTFELDAQGAALRAHWASRGLDELVSLADELQALAAQVKTEDESSELSPYLYAMY